MTDVNKRRSSNYREELKKRLKEKENKSLPSAGNKIIKIKSKNNVNYSKIFNIIGLTVIALSVGYISIYAYEKFSDSKNNNPITIKKTTNTIVKQSLEKKYDEVLIIPAEKKAKEIANIMYNAPSNINFKSDVLKSLNNSDKEVLRNIISNYAQSLDIRDKSMDKSKNVDLVYSQLEGKINILKGKDKELALNGYNVAYPMSVNQFGVVDKIEDYSTPWRQGVSKYDKLIGINGQKINPNANLEDVNSLMFDSRYKSLTWYNSKTKKQFTTNTFKSEPIFGNLVSVKEFQNNTLVLYVKKITSYTPRLIVQLIDTYGKNKKGIIIDLNGLQDFSYNGIPELVWLFNGQKIVKIAEITDHNGKMEDMYSRPVNFNVSQNTLSLINNAEKIIMVNDRTAGSAELFAGSINGIVNGYTTKGDDHMNSYYRINNDHIVEMSNKIVRKPNDKNIQIVPQFNKVILY